MTLLVKDEETLLEHNLRFHHAMGVDGFIITDNNSTDATPAIIERYRQMGWVLAVIHETGTDYRQKQWVDRMIDVARREFAADWIINADGDEFWYPPTGDFHTQLAHLRANVLRCEVIGMRPEKTFLSPNGARLPTKQPNAKLWAYLPMVSLAHIRTK